MTSRTITTGIAIQTTGYKTNSPIALLDSSGSLHLEKAKLVAYSHGLYQKLGDVMGFFGWSVARKEVYDKRMSVYRR